ncbi:MAG: hypothetical protein ACI9LM_001974 [Alteromonadaceae bacterium]|jgi:hypothetical protein
MTLLYIANHLRILQRAVFATSCYSFLISHHLCKRYNSVIGSKGNSMLRFYFILTILGVILPYGAFIPWLIENGVNLSLLFSDAVTNPISIFAWVDVIVSAVALLGFIVVDGKKNSVKGRSFALIGTLTIGVSCGLPLYLYLKEKQESAEKF